MWIFSPTLHGGACGKEKTGEGTLHGGEDLQGGGDGDAGGVSLVLDRLSACNSGSWNEASLVTACELGSGSMSATPNLGSDSDCARSKIGGTTKWFASTKLNVGVALGGIAGGSLLSADRLRNDAFGEAPTAARLLSGEGVDRKDRPERAVRIDLKEPVVRAVAKDRAEQMETSSSSLGPFSAVALEDSVS